MSDRIYRVLFLCTGNSARSILAEALPISSLDRQSLATSVREIGKS